MPVKGGGGIGGPKKTVRKKPTLPKGPRGDSPGDYGRRGGSSAPPKRKPGPYKSGYEFPASTEKKAARGGFRGAAKPPASRSLSGDSPSDPGRRGRLREQQARAVRAGLRQAYKDKPLSERRKDLRRKGPVGDAARQVHGERMRFKEREDAGKRALAAGRFAAGRQLSVPDVKKADALRKGVEKDRKREVDAKAALRRSVSTLKDPPKLKRVEGGVSVRQVARTVGAAKKVFENPAGAAVETALGAGAKSKPARKAVDKGVSKAADFVEKNVRPAGALPNAQTAGIGDDTVKKASKTVANAGAAALQGAIAAATDSKTRGATARTAPGYAKATVGGLVSLLPVVGDPGNVKKLPAEMVKDWNERGERARKDPKAFRKELQKRGAIPELADATLLVGGAGAATGRVATRVAKTGALGKRAQRTVSTPRKKLKVNTNRAVEQPLSGNFWKASVQKGRDAAREKVEARRSKDVEEGSGRGLKSGEGEVVRIRRGSTAGGRLLGGQAKDIRRSTATRMTDANTESKSQTGRETREVRDADRRGKKGLSKGSRAKRVAAVVTRSDKPASGRELYDRLSRYALEATVPLSRGVGEVKKALQRDLDLFEKERQAFKDADKNGREYQTITDEADNIRRAIQLLDETKDADRVLERLAARQPGEVTRAKRVAAIAGDVLREDTATMRRERPAAVKLGIEDAVEAEFGATPRSARVALKKEQRTARREEAQAYRALARRQAAEAQLTGEARVLAQQEARKALRTDSAYRSAVSAENRALRARAAATTPAARATAEQQVKKARAARRAIGGDARERAERELRRDAAGVNKPRTRKEKKRDRALTEREPAGRLRRLEGKAADTLTAQRRYDDANARREAAERKTLGDAEAERQQIKMLKKREVTKRTQAAREELGLQEPAYVLDRPSRHGGSGDYVVTPRVRRSHESGMKLLRMGDRDTSRAAYEHGIARTIKRHHEANAVADIFEEGGYHGPGGRKLYSNLEDAKRDLLGDGYDPADWKAVPLGGVRQVFDDLGEAGDDLAITGDKALHQALQASLDLRGNPGRLQTTGQQFAILPKAAVDELTSMAKPAGAARRTVQKTIGFASRWILATSPLYMPINVGSNIILTAVGAPMAFLRVHHRAYRRLSPEARQYLDRYIGQAPSADMGFSPHYGGSGRGFFGAFQAFLDKDGVKAARASVFNPLTWNMRLDARQTHWFKTQVIYDRMMRDMKRPVNTAIVEGRTIVEILRMKPGPEQARLLRKAEPVMERYRKAADDLLGNWTNYTAAERRYAKSMFMFYGFLRFSTRLAFYTMPVEHPMATAMLAKIGQMRYEEIVDFLQSDFLKNHPELADDEEKLEEAIRLELMNQMGGYVILKGKDGEWKALDTARFNPAAGMTLEAFTAAAGAVASPTDPQGVERVREGASQLVPLPFKTPFELTLGRRLGYGQPLQTRGKMRQFGEDPDLSVTDASMVWLRDYAVANPAVRSLFAHLEKGNPVSDDSIPFVHERPLRPIRRRSGKTAEQVKLEKVRKKQKGPVRAATGAVRMKYEVQEQMKATTLAAMKRSLEARKEELEREGKDGSPEHKRLNEQLKRVRALQSNRPKKKTVRKRNPFSFDAPSGLSSSPGGL